VGGGGAASIERGRIRRVDATSCVYISYNAPR
jgi:hypothetical protein